MRERKKERERVRKRGGEYCVDKGERGGRGEEGGDSDEGGSRWGGGGGLVEGGGGWGEGEEGD